MQGKDSRVQEGNKMIPDKYVGPKAWREYSQRKRVIGVPRDESGENGNEAAEESTRECAHTRLHGWDAPSRGSGGARRW